VLHNCSDMALLFALSALLLPHAADAIPTAAPSPPCTNSYGPGLHEVELGFRKFLLAVPDGLPAGGGRRVPAVIDWHGYSESPWYQNLLVGLEEKLDAYKWIGVLPFGTAPLPTATCCPLDCDEECCQRGERLDSANACSFNAGSCCGAASSRDVNDIEFARQIIDWLQDNMCSDRENVFATGFSNGGMITNRLGCEASALFKGIAPVAGNLRFGGSFQACQPTSPVSWLSVCGDNDNVCTSDFDDTASLWSRVNDCVGEPTTTFVSRPLAPCPPPQRQPLRVFSAFLVPPSFLPACLRACVRACVRACSLLRASRPAQRPAQRLLLDR
jgi:poly(3-hydroxybutyrate) depolymerase